MYYRPGEHQKAYDEVRTAALISAGECTIAIFCAIDTDSLAACRILCRLLEGDRLPHKLVPVSGFDDLTRENDRLSANSHLRSVIMINCGGTSVLQELMTLSDHVRVYVVDAHRPLCLDNLFDSLQIVVLDEGESDEMVEERRAHEALMNDDTDDDDSGDDDYSDGDDVLLTEETDENLDPNEARLARHEAKLERRRQRNTYKHILDDYYSLSYYGQPAALTMYQLAHDLGRVNNDLLWLAMLGVGDQLVYDRVEPTEYADMIRLLRAEAVKFNPHLLRDSGMASVDTTSTSADDTSIQYRRKELRLMLFRHWSLYDSMFHSHYIASKLGIWRQRGRQKLDNLLAQMGLSQQQCHQHYQDMHLDLRRDLVEQLERKAGLFGMGEGELTYECFVRRWGYKATLSVADVVYALTALLEVPVDVVRKLGVKFNLSGFSMHDRWLWSSSSNADPSTSADEDGASMANDAFAGRSGFFLAHDALDNIDLLKYGVALAQSIQRELVRTGTAIIDEKLTRTLRTYRLVVLHENTLNSIDVSLFRHPLTLTKLGLFLVSALRETGRAYLPLVMASYIPESGTYLIVGLDQSAPSDGTDDYSGDAGADSSSGMGMGVGGKKSKFAQAFAQTGDVARATVRQVRFDASVLEVPKADLTRFMEHLQKFLS